MRIDAHLHVWDLSTGDYAWPDSTVPEIERSFTISDVVAELDAAEMVGVVLVQASDTAGENERLFREAERSPRVVGVVGWLPLDDVARAAEALDVARRDDLLVGVRALVHTYPDPRWLLRDDVREGLELVAHAGLAFDVVTAAPAALELVPALGERHPELRIVIDHLAKPPIGGGADERRSWRRLLEEAAANPRVVAKLSGLYAAHGAPSAWTVDSLRPFLDDALEVFGPTRLMYGSDWPVAILGGGYRRCWEAISGFVDELEPHERAHILGRTAAETYRLSPRRLDAARKELS